MRRHPLKVVVSGAFSTGKSTTVDMVHDALTQAGYSLEVLPDVARQSPLPVNREQTAEGSAWLIGEQIRAESVAVAKRPEVVLCDRGVLDIGSHNRMIEPASRRESLVLKAVEDIVTAWSATYDIVFVTRIDERLLPLADGVRDTDPLYQQALDRALCEICDELRLDLVELPHDSAQRTEQIRALLIARLHAAWP